MRVNSCCVGSTLTMHTYAGALVFKVCVVWETYHVAVAHLSTPTYAVLRRSKIGVDWKNITPSLERW